MPWIRYFERSTYSEIDVADTVGWDFNSFDIYDRLETRGTGFNFKFGIIVRPVDFLRIGGAIHTPTCYISALLGRNVLPIIPLQHE